MQLELIRKQAQQLAKANRETEPTVSEVLWFPNEVEVRLVELDTDSPTKAEEYVLPFYFRPEPGRGLTAPMAIALVHPEDRGKAKLPEGWGDWNDAEVLELDES